MNKLARIAVFLMRLALYVLTLVLLAITVAALFFGTGRWWAEVTTHFIHLYFIVGCAFLLWSALMKSKWCMYANGVIVAATLFLLVPYYLPAPNGSAADARAEEASQGIKILHFNPQAGKNRNYAAAWTLINEQQPDLIAISEVESEWQRRLQQSLPEYPHKIMSNTGGGIALLSKQPFTFQQIQYSGPRRRPRILASLPVDGREVQVIAVHPFIPVQKFMKWRNEEFKLWAPEVQSRTTPTIVIGDFNSSPWSPYMRDFLESAKLRDSSLGYGVQPSWPANVPFVPPLTPIDNCFVSEHFTISKRELGPAIGSDHLPILVTMRIKK